MNAISGLAPRHAIGEDKLTHGPSDGPRQRMPLMVRHLSRQRQMRTIGATIKRNAAALQSRLEPPYQGRQDLRGPRGAAPEDAGSRELANAVDLKLERRREHSGRNRFSTRKPGGVQLPQKHERQMQIRWMHCPRRRRQRASGFANQSIARLRPWPERQKPRLGHGLTVAPRGRRAPLQLIAPAPAPDPPRNGGDARRARCPRAPKPARRCRQLCLRCRHLGLQSR